MARNLGEAECPYCGKTFIKQGYTQIFCSKECQIANYKKKRGVADGDTWAICHWCGEYFKRVRGTRRIYCCAKCAIDSASAKAKGKVWKEHTKKVAIPKKRRKKTKQETDGFTWDDIRQVFGEYGISSYHKAVEILKQRKKEKESG